MSHVSQTRDIGSPIQLVAVETSIGYGCHVSQKITKAYNPLNLMGKVGTLKLFDL